MKYSDAFGWSNLDDSIFIIRFIILALLLAFLPQRVFWKGR